MTLFLFLFEWCHKSHFWKTEFFIFDSFDIKGSPLWKKNLKISKNYFLSKKLFFFLLNLHCKRPKHSFEVYNSHVSKNFEFWPIFAYKISIFATVFQWPAWPKLQFIKCCFWCLWTAKDLRKLDGSQFWALECLLTASGWLESIRAIMAPPRVITSFQSSCEIGLNDSFFLLWLFTRGR